MKKPLDQLQAELSNMIMNFAMENKMSYAEVKESVKHVKGVFLSDGIVKGAE